LPVLELWDSARGNFLHFVRLDALPLCGSTVRFLFKTIHRPAFVRAASILKPISHFSSFCQNVLPIIHDSITKSSLERAGRICYNNHMVASYAICLPALPVIYRILRAWSGSFPVFCVVSSTTFAAHSII
jgi:hypothetical protein